MQAAGTPEATSTGASCEGGSGGGGGSSVSQQNRAGPNLSHARINAPAAPVIAVHR